jgi:hypothetical protein
VKRGLVVPKANNYDYWQRIEEILVRGNEHVKNVND